MSARILVLDIETSPALYWGYGLFNQNHGIKQIEREPEIIGWATRWEDEPASTCTWYDGPAMEGYAADLPLLWEQLDQATHVMHFNGKSFDIPWVNHSFIKHKINKGRPPSPYKQVDLMKQIRGTTRNISNKLDWLSRDLFELEGKIGVNALDQWIKMYRAFQAGDMKAYEKARAEMARYCKQDVNLLPKMKRKYLPWMSGLGINQYNGLLDSCPNCGGANAQRRGIYSSGAGNYQRYRCSCGTWYRGNRSIEMSTTRNAK
jgi:hypothetical protein